MTEESIPEDSIFSNNIANASNEVVDHVQDHWIGLLITCERVHVPQRLHDLVDHVIGCLIVGVS